MNKISKLTMALMMVGALYSADAFAAKMQPCPAGTYSSGGAKSRAECKKCSDLGANMYAPSEASTKCKECPNGKIANEEGTGCLDSCKTTQLLASGKCTACPTGYICNGTATFECMDGYYMGKETSTDAKTKKKTTKQACVKCGANMKTCTGTTEFTCNDGFYKNGKACTACPKNYQTCTQEGFTCKDGFYENQTACTACPAGYYCSSVEDGPSEQFCRSC